MRVKEPKEKYAPSLDFFVKDKILYEGDYHDKKRLEEQPEVVLEVVSNLMEFLIKNGLLDKEEFCKIINYTYPENLEFVED